LVTQKGEDDLQGVVKKGQEEEEGGLISEEGNEV